MIVFVAMRRNARKLPALVRLAADWGVGALWVQNLSHSVSDTDPSSSYREIREYAEEEALWGEGDRSDAERIFRRGGSAGREPRRRPEAAVPQGADARSPCAWRARLLLAIRVGVRDPRRQGAALLHGHGLGPERPRSGELDALQRRLVRGARTHSSAPHSPLAPGRPSSAAAVRSTSGFSERARARRRSRASSLECLPLRSPRLLPRTAGRLAKPKPR
jgi:hypothetical protein